MKPPILQNSANPRTRRSFHKPLTVTDTDSLGRREALSLDGEGGLMGEFWEQRCATEPVDAFYTYLNLLPGTVPLTSVGEAHDDGDKLERVILE